MRFSEFFNNASSDEAKDAFHIEDISAIPVEKLNAVSKTMQAWGYDSRGGEDVRRFLRTQSALQAIRGKNVPASEWDTTKKELEKNAKEVDLDGDWARAFMHVMGTKKITSKKKAVGDAFRKAISKMGTTYNLKQAGFIMPNGSLLNMGMYDTRGKDHREVAAFVSGKFDSQTAAMYDFMERGAIRISFPAFIDIRSKPTSAQMATIRRFVEEAGNSSIELEMKSAIDHFYKDFPAYTDYSTFSREISSFWGK